MRIIYTLSLFLLSHIICAQNEWPPIGSFWNYVGDTIAHNGNLVDAQLTVYVVDTVEINGTTHKITRQIGHEIINDGSTDVVNRRWDEQVCCLLNRNDTIFQVDPHFGIEQFLYSFNSQVGDSMTVNQTIPYIVDSISVVVFGTDTARMIHYKKECSGGNLGAYVLEKVGPLEIEDTVHSDSACFTGAGNSYEWHFQCYSDSKINYPDPCVVLKTTISTVEASKTTLKYNNFNKQLEIQSNSTLEGQLLLFDLLGNKLIQHRVHANGSEKYVDVSFLDAGIYLASYFSTYGKPEILKISVQ